MIVMKSVRGPSGYNPTDGFNVTVGELQVINQSSGKMVMASVVSSCDLRPIPTAVSGNILTVKMITSSGAFLTTSTILSSVEVVVVADGY